MRQIALEVNGARVMHTIADNSVTLVNFLREQMGLTGTHVGCDTAQCGACTVLVDGKAIKSCNVLVVQVDGKRVRTIEGVADGETLHPMQQAFSARHALQCGFCTPGMVMRGISMACEGTPPDPERIRSGLCGNLCRCTGYEGIVLAIADGMREMQKQGDVCAGL
ncbi:(2Fe-2S)-binding protein [Variovorax paradoxus]|uniref:(2Fe-2S)-binding protein n=1 Tax=Variovorax paradoxus TaxID=34073 RepID=UPI0027857EB9|nr:(2Fe-2S)-binding protein [Variovorax paradoxus]MDP9932802.1 carbon-monoxide dehydrogenase small subunit [Variovorax paradoxus]